LAIIGAAATFSAMVYFLWVAGARPIVGALLVAGILGYYIVFARLRAETGLGFSMFPLELEDTLVTPLGPRFYRLRELVIIIAMRWTYGQGFGVIYEAICGNTLESFKIADAAGLSLRRLTRGMVLAFAITLPLALVAILTGIYHYGWFNLRGLRVGWLGGQAIGDGERIIWLALTHTPGPDVNGIVALSLGAAIALFLGAMRLQYWWWPFHPVGFMAAMCWGMHWYWAAFLVGWACKTLIVRYGGLKLYSRTLPLAIGLVVGDLLNQGAWAVLGFLTRGGVVLPGQT
jgi:hypothetical protein